MESKTVRVYFKMTGQVLEYPRGMKFPAGVQAMISGGTAMVLEDSKAEAAAIDPAQERAVTSAQNAPKKKK